MDETVSARKSLTRQSLCRELVYYACGFLEELFSLPKSEMSDSVVVVFLSPTPSSSRLSSPPFRMNTFAPSAPLLTPSLEVVPGRYGALQCRRLHLRQSNKHFSTLSVSDVMQRWGEEMVAGGKGRGKGGDCRGALWTSSSLSGCPTLSFPD